MSDSFMDTGNRHVDVNPDSTAKKSVNPLANSSKITVSVPETVSIRLVDATVLSDYEVWSLVTSIVSSAAVGFFVAYVQTETPNDKVFGIVSLMFLVLLILAGLMAFTKRRTLSKKTRTLRFSVGEQLPSDEEIPPSALPAD